MPSLKNKCFINRRELNPQKKVSLPIMKWPKLSNKWRGKLINLYLPYLGAGIKVVECNDAMTRFVVEMRLNRFNKNIMGTHFGGSLYAMCDPFFMWILMENLGRDFIVWDKAATIRFKKPGTGTVRAIFEITQENISAIREEVPRLRKKDYFFYAEVTNENGDVVAEVDKTVYVRYQPRD
jgi:acyl-coenzyme A thioesterase PaaI-like protein